jgi:hypothetical protein
MDWFLEHAYLQVDFASTFIPRNAFPPEDAGFRVQYAGDHARLVRANCRLWSKDPCGQAIRLQCIRDALQTNHALSYLASLLSVLERIRYNAGNLDRLAAKESKGEYLHLSHVLGSLS